MLFWLKSDHVYLTNLPSWHVLWSFKDISETSGHLTWPKPIFRHVSLNLRCSKIKYIYLIVIAG